MIAWVHTLYKYLKLMQFITLSYERTSQNLMEKESGSYEHETPAVFSGDCQTAKYE